MSNMKCPICGNDLEQYHTGLVCYRHCLNSKNVWGGEETLKELDRTRKALDFAIDVIQTVAKMSDKLSREYGETLVEQLDNIQAYCWQEGYVLTHEEDLKKALTALEQKEGK